MCGIYITNIPYSSKKVEEKLTSINFRGPDNMGILKKKSITLGHLRLSILDLDARSNQPMNYEDLIITYNGEIYNFLDIKNELINIGYEFKTTSDTEVLLIGYKEWGKKLLDKINGMFAFCIYDVEKQNIFCARDRLGVKPFYYYWNNGIFEICSQLRPLVNNESKINEEAISIFLECDYIPSPYSAIIDVYKLPPGHFMEIELKSGALNIEKYWDLKKVKTRNISYKKAKEELHTLLKDAVKIRLQSDVPIGSFLSGGVDSALISSIAGKISNKPINTFSIGFEDKTYDESKIAEEFSRFIKSNHKTTICKVEDLLKFLPALVRVYDEPFADDSALPSLLLNSVTKPYATVAISGDGGDESFLGYNHFDWVMKYKWIFLIPLTIRKVIAKSFLPKLFGKNLKIAENVLLTPNENSLIAKIFTGFDSLSLSKDRKWLSFYEDYKYSSLNLLQRTADLNIKLWLENDSNVKVDRASMAYSVEVRSPFLDYRIVEFARQIPISYRYKKNNKKRILKDLLAEYIPHEIFDQPKKGFSMPIGAWIKNELRNEFLSAFDVHFLNMVPNLDIDKFNSQLKSHMNGDGDFHTSIWKMYVLRKWYEEFGFIK